MDNIARWAVHPRACGERCNAMPRTPKPTGSSPRLRGTRSGDDGRLHQDRFIPAPAGNALRSAIVSMGGPVHPRACGERCSMRSRDSSVRGSSPRLRGTRRPGRCRFALRRFIPAPAGNAGEVVATEVTAQVHPRACGERPSPGLPITGSNGSSPRLRGTRSTPGRSQARHRFIPAPAGNATHSTPTSATTAVHPRACGERDITRKRILDRDGSSPRLRGTRSL